MSALQAGAGRKHDRSVRPEAWQWDLVQAAPWSLLRGLVHSDGCFFINRTGPYAYLSVAFSNRSTDILDLFCAACDLAGAEHRRGRESVRVYRRASVAAFAAFVGLKR